MTSSKNGVSRKILDTAVNTYAITFLITLKLLAEFPATFTGSQTCSGFYFSYMLITQK